MLFAAMKLRGCPPPSPLDDIGVINTELALADYQQIEKMVEKLSRQIKGDTELVPLYELANVIKEHLATGSPLWQFLQLDTPEFVELNQKLQFLTAKKVIYIANVDEDSLIEKKENAALVEKFAKKEKAEVITICADLEQGMHSLSLEERVEYLEISGITNTGLDNVIVTSFQILGLICYFTFNEQEVRSWTIKDGWTAPMAAGQIHTDFEAGFIRAEVASFEAFAENKSWAALKTAGISRSEGRNYVVQDGEIILFRFNV